VTEDINKKVNSHAQEKERSKEGTVFACNGIFNHKK